LRVGVIGTGSSGIQVIPEVARQAEHLYVFQRTPNYSLPANNRARTEEEDREYKRRYRQTRARARQTSTGIAYHPDPEQSALDVSPEERNRVYEMQWQRGGNSFIRLFN